MDFALNEEQQLIVKTTREFVRQRARIRTSSEVEETGVLREDLQRELKAEGDRGGSVCRQHADRGRRRGARYA